MTEAEWLACSDVGQMVQELDLRRYDRKLRLFAAACCRLVWDHIADEAARNVVELSERYADQEISGEQLVAAVVQARGSPYSFANSASQNAAAIGCASYQSSAEKYLSAAADAVAAIVGTRWVAAWQGHDKQAEWRTRAAQRRLFRDIVGNPFRPVAVDPAWLAWNHGTVPAIAHRVYDERAFHDLPILADALEDAGCTNDDLLGHCRGGGPHARGCWAVDLLLGKS